MGFRPYLLIIQSNCLMSFPLYCRAGAHICCRCYFFCFALCFILMNNISPPLFVFCSPFFFFRKTKVIDINTAGFRYYVVIIRKRSLGKRQAIRNQSSQGWSTFNENTSLKGLHECWTQIFS